MYISLYNRLTNYLLINKQLPISHYLIQIKKTFVRISLFLFQIISRRKIEGVETRGWNFINIYDELERGMIDIEALSSLSGISYTIKSARFSLSFHHDIELTPSWNATNKISTIREAKSISLSGCSHFTNKYIFPSTRFTRVVEYH